MMNSSDSIHDLDALVQRLRSRMTAHVSLRDAAEAADAIERLRTLVWRAYYENEPDEDRPDLYPCLLCGYSGSGFYQPDTHSCAALGEKP